MNYNDAAGLLAQVKHDDPSLHVELAWDMKGGAGGKWFVVANHRRTHYHAELHSTADWDAEKNAWGGPLTALEVVA